MVLQADNRNMEQSLFLIEYGENIGKGPVLDSIDWAKPNRDHPVLAFQGVSRVIVCAKALDNLKTQSFTPVFCPKNA